AVHSAPRGDGAGREREPCRQPMRAARIAIRRAPEEEHQMLDTLAPRLTYSEASPTLGTFEVEPLDRGFGHTFGNSLRRVLLSSLEGAAVTSVKIEGVLHEFSTLEGVKEDVTDIILNLRGLVCRLYGDAAEIEVELSKV